MILGAIVNLRGYYTGIISITESLILAK